MSSRPYGPAPSMLCGAVALVAAGLLATLTLRAQGQQQPSAQKPSSSGAAAAAGNVENGKKLYNKVGCWECHGHTGRGGRAGPRLTPNPIPLESFIKYVRAPEGDEMPPYTAKVLSDAQLADIHAYLKSISPPPDVKDIPLLNRKDGGKQD
jgi:mono/diheme cytochrome c family protein